MKKSLFCTFVLSLLLNCASKSEIKFSKNFNLDPDKCFSIEKLKKPARIEVVNLSNVNLQLKSGLKLPQTLNSQESLKYHFPKKSSMKICNENDTETKFKLAYKSSAVIKIIKK